MSKTRFIIFKPTYNCNNANLKTFFSCINRHLNRIKDNGKNNL